MGKPCGAVIPRCHLPLWLSEGCKRDSRVPPFRRLFLTFRPCCIGEEWASPCTSVSTNPRLRSFWQTR
jgi:hypothetical protein